MLGPLRVVVDGEPVKVGGPRPRAVLGVLLAHAGTAVSAQHLIDQVWGEQPPATAVAALQVHVAALRKVIGDVLVTTPSGYQLVSEDVDALRFETSAGSRDVIELRKTLSLWRGEPFSDVPVCPDVQAARTRLTELRLSAAERLMRTELAQGRHAQILTELSGLLAEHPTSETLAELLMLALYRSGRATDARNLYAQLRDRLRTDLDIAPGDNITALDGAIARRDPTHAPPTPIPAPASRFVGRRDELDRLTEQLGQTRLLTVTGPGGVGKTRIAVELARELTGDHPDGSHLIELAALPASGSVAERLAAKLDVRAPQLVEHLRDQRALIVLDNCEHVIDACAALVSELLAHCTGLRIVATSREPLGVPGELVWPLAGLTVPESDEQSDAVRLLIDRGSAARPGFAVTATDAAVAGHLCRQLDGLPLAIELAAAQLRTRSLREVADLLDRRLDLADSRSRTTPDRHRTMRAAIDWSHQLLADEEQELFQRLAVFTDGCQPAVAEQVCPASPDLLAQLVDRSLLTVESTPDGTRLRMLELVGEYARQQLASSSDEPDLRRRHAAWCVELAQSAAKYGGSDHPALVRLLDTELANLRAAVQWCLDDDPLQVLRIVSPLWWYLWTRGLMTEGADWLHRALETTDPTPTPLRGSALRAAAALNRNSGNFDAAADLGKQCLAVYQSLDDHVGMITAYGGLCVTALSQRDYDGALHFGEQSRRLAAEAGDQLRVASALNNIGLAHRCLRNLDEATASFTEAMTNWQAVGDLRGEAGTINNLATTLRQQGRFTESRQLCLRSLRQYQELDLTEGVLDVLSALACLDVAEGQPETGLRLLAVTRRERDRLGAPPFIEDEIADEQTALAAATSALGDRAAAITTAAANLPLDHLLTTLLPDPL